jgi:copper(I)-binding protein
MRHLIAALMIALGVCVPAHPASSGTGSVTVEHAWARATPKGAPNAAVYLTLVNSGSETDRLIGASSPVADNIQFHEERDENGVSKMLALQAVDVAPLWLQA